MKEAWEWAYKMINEIFMGCVAVLQWLGDWTGMGYQLANLVVFVVIQPGMIALFLVLWLRERFLFRRYRSRAQ